MGHSLDSLDAADTKSKRIDNVKRSILYCRSELLAGGPLLFNS
jgi:hypothetical protein